MKERQKMNNVHPIFKGILKQIDRPASLFISLDKEESDWGLKKEALQQKVASEYYQNLNETVINRIIDGLSPVVLI